MDTKRISKRFFVLAYALSVGISLAASLVRGVTMWHEEPELFSYLAGASGVASLFALVVFLVFVHRIWRSIQDGHARTSAGKAAGFLLIPFFNIYWFFQVIWGFAKDYNKHLSHHDTAALRLSERLYLAASILIATRWLYRTIASLKPITGVGDLLGHYSYFLTIPTLILAIIIIYKSCDAVNALQEHQQ